jgi:hypothetical protein
LQDELVSLLMQCHLKEVTGCSAVEPFFRFLQAHNQ